MKIRPTHHRAIIFAGSSLLTAELVTSRWAVAQETAPAALHAPGPSTAPAVETTSVPSLPAASPTPSVIPTTATASPAPSVSLAASGALSSAASDADDPLGSSDPHGTATPQPAVPQKGHVPSVRPIRPTAPLGMRAGAFRSAVADAVVNEEVLASPQEAARHYENLIAEFDGQRAGAAQAVFRLGESYRKLGRNDEARVQYARILREFVDYPELTALSLQQLGQVPPRAAPNLAVDPDAKPTSNQPRSSDHSNGTLKEERSLLQEEIQLLDRELAETQARIASGIVPSSALFPIQREILQVKRQLMRLAAPTPAHESLNTPAEQNTNTFPALEGGAAPAGGDPNTPATIQTH